MMQKIKSKNVSQFRPEDLAKLTLSDLTCPICLSIFTEPVCMPCSHIMCLPCFNETLDQTSLQCPMCRMRISVWARKASKAGQLVNEELWKWIQQHWKDKVNAKLLNLDDSSDSYIFTSHPKTCAEGEIRKEYEEELKTIENQRLQQQLEEEMASKQLILKLQQEQEKQRLEEELASKELILQLSQQTLMEEKELHNDKEVARRVRQEFMKSPKLTPSRQGPLDAFLDTHHPGHSGKKSVFDKGNSLARKSLRDITHHSSSDDNTEELYSQPSKKPRKQISRDKENNQESMSPKHHKKQVRRTLVEMKKFSKYESDSEDTDLDIDTTSKSRKLSVPDSASSKNARNLKSRFSSIPDSGSSEDGTVKNPAIRKSWEKVDNEISVVVDDLPSTSYGSNNMDVTAFFSCEDTNMESLSDLIEQQKLLEAKLEQERLDRKLALSLQRELAKAPIDRRKGTEDEYSLRHRDEESSSKGTRNYKLTPKNSKKVKKSSTSTPSPQTKNKSGRQITLMESFSKASKVP